jgi:hypothetical protein
MQPLTHKKILRRFCDSSPASLAPFNPKQSKK